MNGEIGASSSIRGRQKAISNYRRRWIIFNTRMIIHKIRYSSSSIEVPPFFLSIGMRVRHPHSYKGFLSIKAYRKNNHKSESVNMMVEKQMMETKIKGCPPLSGRFGISMRLLKFVFQTFCCRCAIESEKVSTAICRNLFPFSPPPFVAISLWRFHAPL